jgi:hypothetical protein
MENNNLSAAAYSLLRFLPTIIGLAIYGALFSGFVLKDGLEYGGDENFELSKAVCYFNGFKLYEEIWSDQPPLYTLSLALVRTFFTDWIVVARVVSSVSLIALAGTLSFLVTRATNGAGGIVCVLLLLTAPRSAVLGVSAMQEIPSLALAVIAIYLYCRTPGQTRYSGMLDVLVSITAAAAVLIKLTAAVPILSAAAACLLLRQDWVSRKREFARIILIGAISLMLSALFWKFLFPFNHAKTILSSHLNLSGIRGPLAPGDFTPSRKILYSVFPHIVTAAAGIKFSIRYGISREGMVAIVWVVANVLIAMFHRPWWDIYWVSFVCPLAILSGIFFGYLLKFVKELPETCPFPMVLLFRAGASLWLMALIIAAFRVVENDISSLESEQAARKSERLQLLKTYNVAGNLSIISPQIIGIRAGCIQVPELAVLSFKRFWSEQADSNMICNVVERRKPEFIALPAGGYLDKTLSQVIKTKYTTVTNLGEWYVYKLGKVR